MWWHFVLSRIWRNLDNKDIESDRNRISEELLKLGGRPKISIFRGGDLPYEREIRKFSFLEGGRGFALSGGYFLGEAHTLLHTTWVAEGGGSQSKICPSLEGWSKFHIVGGWGRLVEGRLLFQGTLNYYSMFF